MLRNVCGDEQWKRFIVGLVLMNVGLFLGGWMAVVGFYLLETAMTAYCPLNHLLNRNSCTVRQSS